MPFELPTSLSPSKVSSFTDCALAFRFSAIDRLPEPPSAPATKGTLVHAALERLFCLPNDQRTLPAALTALDQAFEELREHPEYAGLALPPEAETTFLDDAEQLVRRYFTDRGPVARSTRRPRAEARGAARHVATAAASSIDSRSTTHGRFIVTDYKTGRVPSEMQERSRLGGVHFYAFLLEQILGQRPAKVQLLYLSEPVHDHDDPHRAVGARPRTQGACGVVGDRTGLRARELQTEAVAPVRLVCLPSAVPAFGGNPTDLDAFRIEAGAAVVPMPLASAG